MTWYSLDKLIEGLSRQGFVPAATNDPGVMLLKGPMGTKPMHSRVVLPMNAGEFLPERTVRRLLSEVDFDVDAFLQDLPVETR